MKISDRAFILDSFQSSVNLDFDLQNTEKLLEYVPTADICSVLDSYFDSLILNKNQASFLIGPYGKGKSFITLTFLQIACGLFDKNALNVLLQRISKINKSLAEKINNFVDNKRYFIPVLIDPDYDNLKQSFMVALRSSLDAYGFHGLVPKSSFDICREILSKWRNDQAIASGRLSSCSKSLSLKDIDKGLASYSPDAYEKFVDLYNCVTVGQRFNPLINENVSKLYADVSAELMKLGRGGLIVIFDEFSKFLDSKSKKLSEDLKFIQEFAEKASRSDEHYRIFFSCIAHKPIDQYGDRDSKIFDQLKTVDGRFITYRFQRGMADNMELISNAIRKRDGFDAFFSEFINKHKFIFEETKQLNLLDQDEDLYEFAKGCYPLSALSAYLLVRISELVAQNERTLFTFISGNDVNGLRRAMNRSDDQLIESSTVYDYFQDIFETSDDKYIRDISYLSKSALKFISDDVQSRIIKSLALIKILNDPRSLPSSKQVIRLCVSDSQENVLNGLNILEKEGILRESLADGNIDFSFAGSKEINRKADLLLSKELRKINPVDYLNQIYESSYYLPREYNAKNRILRYGRYFYCDYQTFLGLHSFDGVINRPYDFLIIRVIGENIDSEAVLRKTLQINDRLAFVQTPKQYNHQSLIKLLRRCAAYSRISETLKNDGSKSVEPILEQCKKEICNLVDDGFKGSESYFYCTGEEIIDHVSFINLKIENVFDRSPIINNELLNKGVITSQYRKARNDVVDFVLAHGDNKKEWSEIFSFTSAQNTIWRIFVDNINDPQFGIRPVIDLIKKDLDECNGKISIKSIVDKLSSDPYGIRGGVIPLFFAVAISEINRFSDASAILYYKNREVPFDAIHIEEASADAGGNYFFKVSKGAKERGEYIHLIIELFGGHPLRDAISNTGLALDLFKRWYRNLPQVVRSGSREDYPISFNGKDEALLASLSKFDINPTDFLFETLPSILKFQGDLKSGLNEIGREKSRLEAMPDSILRNEFSDLFDSLSIVKGSLLAGLKDFLRQFEYKEGDLIGNQTYADFADFVSKSNSFDNATFIKEASPILLKTYFEDWSKGTKDIFEQKLIGWKKFVKAFYSDENREKLLSTAKIMEKIPTKDSISPMANLLEGRIRESIKEFGSSVNSEDIAYVLMRILKDAGSDNL